MATLETKRDLERAIAEGSPAPSEAPGMLPLESIREFPDVFQPRGPAGPASKAHVRELAKTPKGGHPLDPITVFWVGNAWAAIDGHHRLAAYRFAKWKSAIPVTTHRGTLDGAMGYAGKLNSGEKLLMTNAEKKATAWRLTTCTLLSKEQVRKASGMSDRFLGYMRAAHTKLIKTLGVPADELAGMSWRDAQLRAAGDVSEEEEINRDAWIEEQAQEIANRLLDALGKQGMQKHEVLARALWIYDSRLPDSLREHWDDERGRVQPLEEANPDF